MMRGPSTRSVALKRRLLEAQTLRRDIAASKANMSKLEATINFNQSKLLECQIRSITQLESEQSALSAYKVT